MAQHRMTAVGARALLPGYRHYVTVYILIHLGTVHFFEVGGLVGFGEGGSTRSGRSINQRTEIDFSFF